MIHRASKYPYFNYLLNEVEVDGEPAFLLRNSRGNVMSKTEFRTCLEYLNRFYESEGVEEWIEKNNRYNEWTSHPLFDTPIVDGKHVLPRPVVKEKTYRKDLNKDWSRTCEWCGKKYGSQEGGHYYTFWETIVHHRLIDGMCCSRACAENLWFDKLVQWIKEEGIEDIFHTDKTLGI